MTESVRKNQRAILLISTTVAEKSPGQQLSTRGLGKLQDHETLAFFSTDRFDLTVENRQSMDWLYRKLVTLLGMQRICVNDYSKVLESVDSAPC